MSRGIQNRTEASSTGGTSESLTPLPQGWSYVPLGALCSMVAGGTPQSDTDSYWGGNDDPQNTPWISISDMSQVDLVANTEKYVTPLGLKSAGLNPGEIGTILFAMYASVGEVAVCGISAVWNQALLGLIPLNTEILHSPFLYYALKTLKPHLPVYFRSNTQHNLNAGTVSRLRIPLPPLESQQRIADYLDRETAEIDAAVADLDRYVELLEKRRQVMIAQSVSGTGSNRARVHPRTLPGGQRVSLEWIEGVPADWHISKAQFVLEYQKRDVKEDDEIVTAFRDGQVTLRRNRRTDGFTMAEKEIGYQHICEGDLVVHSMDGGFGAIGVSDSCGKASPVVHAYTSSLCDLRFVAYQLRAAVKAGWIAALAKGIRVRSTQFDRPALASLNIAYPTVETQQRIADYLDRETAEIDSLVAKSTKLRDLLLKRRSVLIAEVVTGRKRV